MKTLALVCSVTVLVFALVVLVPIANQTDYSAYPQPMCPHGTEVSWYTTDNDYDLSDKQVVSICRNPRTLIIVGEERFYDKDSAQLLMVRGFSTGLTTLYRMGGTIRNFVGPTECGGAEFCDKHKGGRLCYKFLNPCYYATPSTPPTEDAPGF